MSNQIEFIKFSIERNILSFGEFKTKAGRLSPYFFNAGGFNSGSSLGVIGNYYARRLIESGVQFDMLFGPAYKGIALATATAIALASNSLDIPLSFNRKEAKDHGEGGLLVGAPLMGRVVIIDDVISAGTSVNESVEIIRAQGAEPVAVLIALDRMERSGTDKEIGRQSAAQAIETKFGIPVISIACLDGLLSFLSNSNDMTFQKYLPKVIAYRDKYGAM